MPHGDLSDGRFVGCACTACTDTRNFAEFRDLAEPPPRPSKIDTRLEAAAFLRWHAFELVSLVDQVEEVDRWQA